MSLINSHIGGFAYFTIPLSKGFIDYDMKYRLLVKRFSSGYEENGLAMISSELSDQFRNELIKLNTEHSKDILFREEQLQSIMN